MRFAGEKLENRNRFAGNLLEEVALFSAKLQVFFEKSHCKRVKKSL